ncbi:hypothetical protein BV898_15633 [Hypsibius exemplaris]|uniref:Uncharacterized protein n=1 Tax=Hypsibius exemplaris TaxID=2072580 RepID=A0A9X6NEA7_HYPEX|nr:hypothetical protein BV898_15633 [Hypsibius exemplaris]
MLLGERRFAQYVGDLPRHWSLRESPEFTVTRRYDISVGSRLYWGYVSSDEDDNGFPRASQKRTVSHLSTSVRDPPKRITTLKRTPVQMSSGRKRSMSPTEESRVLVDYPCGQLESSLMDLVSQDAAGDGSDIELVYSVGRRHQIIVDHDDWDEQFEEEEPFQPSRNLTEQSVLVIEPYADLPPACYDLEEPALSSDFNLSDIAAELETHPVRGRDAD